MKGFKDTTRVQYFRGGQVTREKACGGSVKKATGGAVKSFLKKHDIGTYTDSKGRVITHDDLPADVKAEIKWMGALRDLSKSAGNTANQKAMQKKINKTYDPETRDEMMKGFKGNRFLPLPRAEGGRVTDPIKNKTGGKNDPEYGDYAISGAGAPANETKAVRKAQAAKTMRDTTGAAMLPAERRAMMKKAEGGKVDMKQDKKTVAAGAHKHERNMHPGKPLTKMQRGGFPSHNRAPMIKAR